MHLPFGGGKVMLEKISLEVGCFGKLPLSPEFIRVNAKGPALQGFDQWLQEGLHGYRASSGGSWIQNYLQSDTWSFLFAVPGGTECLVGVVAPNQDKAGRGFPMVIFLRLDAQEFAGRLHKAPMYFQSFLDGAKQMVEEEWKGYSLQEFRERVNSWEAPEPGNWDSLDRLYQEFLGAYTLDGLLELCEARRGVVSLAAVKARVREMVASHRPSNMSKAGQLMPFPLIYDPAIPFEIPFWMAYLKKMANLAMDCPMLFWNKCPQNGPAVVFMQEAPVSPKSFAKLVHPRSCVESYWPVASTWDGEAGVGSAPTDGSEDGDAHEVGGTLEQLLR
jgi:type VI secretion system protein ImpM